MGDVNKILTGQNKGDIPSRRKEEEVSPEEKTQIEGVSKTTHKIKLQRAKWDGCVNNRLLISGWRAWGDRREINKTHEMAETENGAYGLGTDAWGKTKSPPL